MRLVMDDVIGDDGHAVMFWHGTAERAGKSLDSKGIMAFKVNDEGKFTRVVVPLRRPARLRRVLQLTLDGCA